MKLSYLIVGFGSRMMLMQLTIVNFLAFFREEGQNGGKEALLEVGCC